MFKTKYEKSYVSKSYANSIADIGKLRNKNRKQNRKALIINKITPSDLATLCEIHQTDRSIKNDMKNMRY